MEKEIALRIKIAEAATKRFVENNHFTIDSLAKELKITPDEIYDHFPSRSSILRYYYESRILIYKDRLKEIDGYSEFTLNERLNNLLQTIIDLFEEDREFVLQTYKRIVAAPSTHCNFGMLFRESLLSVFEGDSNISSSSRLFINSLFFQSVFIQLHGLIFFWKNDESHQCENTMALIDKWCTLVEELFYSKTIDKGFDLAKFLVYNTSLKSIIPSSEESI